MPLSEFFTRKRFLASLPGMSLLAAALKSGPLFAGRFEGQAFSDRMIDRFPAFDDARSRKVIFVAHCLINQNARCNGSAETPAAVRKIPEYLLANNISIAQIPCPELGCLGLGREGLIYDQLSTPGSRRYLKNLARDITYQACQYLKHGFSVPAVLGIDCSPSCGVNCHAYNGAKPGKGAFMEELTEEFGIAGLEIPLIGVEDSNPDKAVDEIKALDK